MPQDREEEMRRLNPFRDDVPHGAGGMRTGEERSFNQHQQAPADPAQPALAVGDRHDSYLEADADQGLKARFTEPAHGPDQPIKPQAETRPAPIENAAILPEAPSAWDARPRPRDGR